MTPQLCICSHDRDAHEAIDGPCIYPSCWCQRYNPCPVSKAGYQAFDLLHRGHPSLFSSITRLHRRDLDIMVEHPHQGRADYVENHDTGDEDRSC